MNPFLMLVMVEVGLAVITFAILMWTPAPYGRNIRPGWGPTLPSRAAWIIMESPGVLWVGAVFFSGRHHTELLPCIFLGLWLCHYGHRTFIWPFRMRLAGRRMPWLVVLLALSFNFLNGYINAIFISDVATYGVNDWTRLTLWLGLALFVAGLVINLYADEILRGLRKDGEGGYQLPERGPFRFITSANYFGEMVEWIGWALMTRSPAGWAFALYTAANLAPRARSHHRWYRERFEQIPASRKALIPFVW